MIGLGSDKNILGKLLLKNGISCHQYNCLFMEHIILDDGDGLTNENIVDFWKVCREAD